MKTHSIAMHLLIALGASAAANALIACSTSASDEGTPPQTDAGDASSSDSTARDATGDIVDAIPLDSSSDSASPADADADAPVSVRRPFLVGDRLRVSRVELRDDWTATIEAAPITLDDATRRALAEAWLDDGRHEHASIAAFARFSMSRSCSMTLNCR